MQVVFQDSPIKVQTALVDDLFSAMAENKDRPLLLFYSGGSVLPIFPLLLARLEASPISLSDVWFAPIDERFDVTASNFRAFQALDCYKDFEKAGVQFIDVLAHGHTLQAASYWYNEWIRAVIDRVHMGDGKVISILGMGEDGHTVSLFPHGENEEFFAGEFIDTSRYVVGYDVGDKNQYRERITLTVPALKVFDRNFAYVSGENKKPALTRVIDRSGSIAATPAILWNELNELTVYTDILL